MLRNYLKIALRTLWKQKGITAINVLGLAVGLAVCLLVGLLFWDQASHDNFHPAADRIYRVTTLTANDSAPTPSSPAPLAPTLRQQVTGVETATRMRSFDRTLVLDGQGYNASGLYAEPFFFDVFGFKLAAGNAEMALERPGTAVISQQLARRLYGDEDPMGQTFQLQNGPTVTVTGVIDRAAYRSHLAFDVLISFATLRQTDPAARTNWFRTIGETSTYLHLAKGRDPATIDAGLERLRRQHLSLPDDEDIPRWKEVYRVERLELESLSAVPFSASVTGVEQGTLPGQVGLLLGGLALLVLLAAGFNYVNLSTARSLTRGREIGVRKTMGAHRRQVMGQFIAEAVIVALLALGLALALLEGLVPLFNRLSLVRKVGLDITVEPGLYFYGLAVLSAAGIGVLAGLYPAWHLSSFQPAQVLKTEGQSQSPGFQWMTPRKGMIVLQFLVAFVVLVTGTVLYRQFQHMKGGKYPFRMDHVVRVDLQESDYLPFQQEASRRPGITRVGAVSGIPIFESGLWGQVEVPPSNDSLRMSWYAMDYEATRVLDLPVITTDGFTEARYEQGQIVIVTSAGVKALGFSSSREALGQPLQFQHRPDEQKRQVRIAGVTRNLPNYHSPRDERILFHHAPERFRRALVQVVPGQDSTALHQLQSTWERVATDPFEGGFLRAYAGEGVDAFAEFGGVMGLIAVLTILISCLGLLGIVTYTVRTRTREIGIRKALGATVSSIVGLLSKDVLWLVGTAVLIGMPLAWVINRQVLRNFPFSIDFGLGTLFLVAAVVVGVAFLAVAPPTLRAARTDPATTLRDE